ncbi:MAG: molybdopterin-dependent oxidoreductase [Candidatus Bipolaricaulota bacterium]|nr:molybdopterin-dependent oxidoreductase [Candidatus Bipolaricaulota bacterium]
MKITRRNLIKAGALLGGSALLAERIPWALELIQRAEAGQLQTSEIYALARPENILYSVCQQCNTQCGIKVKILDGVIAKIDGNPYNPWTMVPHLPYQTPLAQAAPIDGALCPKGQAGIQTTYDPYRLVKVLKRKPGTKRGENQWVTIDFHQAIAEIVEGGDLFGEGRVPGLKELWALRDPKVMKAMGDAVKKIWAEKDKNQKQALVNEFKLQFKDYLHLLIDPNHPDLGPKNNQLAFIWGRVKAGRGDLIRRFTQESFGSVNAHGHTTVCQGSLYFACKAMSEQYEFDPKENKYKWAKGRKFYWQADTENAEFVIFVGASPFEGNYGPTNRAPRITEGLVSGRLKIAVVDPRLSKTAAKAWKWLPALPVTEGAFALALIRWIIENRRYDKKYLENANKTAAKVDKEPTWSNATWLVKLDEKGQPRAFLRAQELGLTEEERFVVLGTDGQPIAVDPYDEENPVEGVLHADTELNGIKVKSAFQLLYESASMHTLEEWAQICGVRVRDIIELAREFTAHGKKAAADVHRGVSQHTNGFYNVLAWMTLNVLIGNLDWAGGSSWALTYDQAGGKEGQPFPIAKMHPAKLTPFGISMIRHEVKYEETTLFEDYPAKRPWYPFSSDIYQEEIPSAGDAYPYPIKALFMGSPVYANPAGHTNIEILADPKKIPLIVASDIVIGETSMYADYIFPDLTNLERWEFTGTHPNMTVKVQGVRQPTIAPLVRLCSPSRVTALQLLGSLWCRTPQ